MTADRRRRAANCYRRLLVAYPRAFRDRFADDLLDLFRDLYATRAADASYRIRLNFWLRIAVDTLRHGLRERLTRRRTLPLGAHRPPRGLTMTHLVEDLRHATRALRQQPAVTLVIVATLVLAIGANSAIFTVVNAVLLRPLPYADPARMVMLYEVTPRGDDALVSYPAYEDWRRELTMITGVNLFGAQTANLTGVAEPDRLRAGFVTAGFFDVLGVRAAIGRAFVHGEDRPGAAKVAVVAHRTWQGRFGGDPALVGRALILNNEPHEVIGILPRAFEFPFDDVDVYLPYGSYPAYDNRRASRGALAIARVAAGVDFATAEADLSRLAADISRAHPETNRGWSARLVPLHDVAVRAVGRNLRLLSGAVAFVLLIACANVANLLLARASLRQREMAVRAALGATRARLVRQLLMESVIIAGTGGALGLVVGTVLTDGMLTLLPNLPRADRVSPDGTVLMFTAALSMLTGLVFGIVPALRTSRVDLRAALTEGARGGEQRASSRWRAALVVAELALSLVLLVGAGLLIQSVTRLLSVELGYDPRNLLTLEYRLPRNKYPQPAQQADFHRRVVEAIARVPGVQHAAVVRAIPQSGNGATVGFWPAGEAQPANEAMARAQFNTVTAAYFRAMGIPLVEGRSCGDGDTADAPLAIVVNKLLAERLSPGESAIGRRVRTPDSTAPAVVVGVVGNTRPQLLSSPIAPQIYGCMSQMPNIFASVVAKTAGEPMALARSVQQAVWSVDPEQPVWKVRSSESLVAGSVQTQRFVMLLMSIAAGLALLLAALGTYSVLSYTVQRRAREVGVRMALGATRASIVRLVVGQTAILVMLGVGIGVLAALGLARAIASQLFEVSPRDPWTLAATSLALTLVALAAAWLPTRRAASVDPVVTLRAD